MIFFILMQMKLILYHKKDFALSLISKERVLGTRKWPVTQSGTENNYTIASLKMRESLKASFVT